MRFKAVGQKTGEVYAEGMERSHIFRYLNEKYPYERYDYHKNKINDNVFVYSEPLVIVRKG